MALSNSSSLLTKSQAKALLVLANGMVFKGKSFGAPNKSLGEICFNTSMTGYQEILTDPSYKQQIITFSYPLIGNYGVNPLEMESEKIQAAGIIVKEYVPYHSNFSSTQNLSDFLLEHNIPGIEDIDTRRLILIIRNEGAQNAGIFHNDNYHPKMLEEVQSLPSMKGLDLASEAGTKKIYEYRKHKKKLFRLAVMDFGIKRSILDLLEKNGFALTVFPAKTKFSQIKESDFDCYFLSNGPGDPAALNYAIPNIQAMLAEKKPIFGICLGHQLLGLALGYSRYKLKFGHRGANHPVRAQNKKNIEITSQNHGFAIHTDDDNTMQDNTKKRLASLVKATHLNLNDNTNEGFTGSDVPILSIQYHPEASPGPHDSRYLFKSFFNMVEKYYSKNNKLNTNAKL